MPSAAILQFEPQPDLALPVRLDAGIALETEPVRGEPCRFQTAWPLTLWPVEIESVRWGDREEIIHRARQEERLERAA